MGIKEELENELETTRQNFHHLLDSIPEALCDHPSDNPAWTIGDVLYHITLGKSTLRLRYAPAHIVPMFFGSANKSLV